MTARASAECSPRSALYDNRAWMWISVRQAIPSEREGVLTSGKVEVVGLCCPADIAVVSAVVLSSLRRHRQQQQHNRGSDKYTSHRSPIKLLGKAVQYLARRLMSSHFLLIIVA